MKKLIMGLGLSAIVGFSAAASAGQCTMNKLKGWYVVSGTTDDTNSYYGAGFFYRIVLNKNGNGKVVAAAELIDGEIKADYVQFPIKWDVAGDCTGNVFVDDGRGGINMVFAVSGRQSEPVLTGLADASFRGMSGLWRAEKVRF